VWWWATFSTGSSLTPEVTVNPRDASIAYYGYAYNLRA
jgi:hypothetical protein